MVLIQAGTFTALKWSLQSKKLKVEYKRMMGLGLLKNICSSSWDSFNKQGFQVMSNLFATESRKFSFFLILQRKGGKLIYFRLLYQLRKYLKMKVAFCLAMSLETKNWINM